MTDNQVPAIEYRTIVQDSGDPGYVNRMLVGTATTGLVRIEWVSARYSQIIPVNWSIVTMLHYLNAFVPLRYQVADAQNLIAKHAIEKEFQWLLFLEHDVLIPPDCFVRFNDYMRNPRVPIVSGLYYTRSRPAEPLIFRGRGTSYYDKWKMGDLVWCDGIPTGIMLIHVGILKAMWDESPEYMVGSNCARRIFNSPRQQWLDPESYQYNTLTGTSDLDWCTRVIEGRYFEKAGWPRFQTVKYPFLVDTRIFCRHIDHDGTQYP